MRGSIVLSDYIEQHWSEKLEASCPGCKRIVLRPEGMTSDPRQAEVAYFSGDLFPERSREFFFPLLEAAELRWLHTFSAGVDHPIFHRFLEAGVRLTTSSGAAAAAIAESVLFYILHLSRGHALYEEARRAKAWQPHDLRELAGAKLVIAGLGPIGREVARRARAFDMDILGVTRSPRGDEGFPVLGLDALDEAIARADYFVLALPLTPQTRGLIDRRRLGRMKPDAFFINVARGELVEEPALIDALREQRIAGAALDVFEEEPLPAASALWELPNVIVTPHASGRSLASNDRATAIFLDNLARYGRGEPLRNEVAAAGGAQ